MQAQTTGKQFSGSRKVIGGLLIAAALIAGAVGATTVGDLEIPGIDSDANTARPLVYDTHVGPRHGEGLPLSVEQLDTAEVNLRSPLGEGFPMTEAQPAERPQLSPQGEGLPMGSGR